MTPQQFAAHLLAEPRRCGTYRIAAGWATEHSTPELSWKTLAPLPRIDKDSLLDALGRALDFPAYYGRNWDAAWDCLTELDWPDGRVLVVHLPIPADRALDDAALATFLGLLDDASRHWAAQGRALCLLVEATQPAPPALAGIPDAASAG